MEAVAAAAAAAAFSSSESSTTPKFIVPHTSPYYISCGTCITTFNQGFCKIENNVGKPRGLWSRPCRQRPSYYQGNYYVQNDTSDPRHVSCFWILTQLSYLFWPTPAAPFLCLSCSRTEGKNSSWGWILHLPKLLCATGDLTFFLSFWY